MPGREEPVIKRNTTAYVSPPEEMAAILGRTSPDQHKALEKCLKDAEVAGWLEMLQREREEVV